MGRFITIEANSLSEALDEAATTLGAAKNDLEFDYDRSHFASGAATVRIHVAKKDPNAAEAIERIKAEVQEILKGLSLEADVEVRPSLASVHVVLLTSPSSSAAPRSDDDVERVRGVLIESAQDLLEGRELRINTREVDPDGARRAPRPRDRDRDRGPPRRDRDRGPPRGGDRDRGPRSERGDRGPRRDGHTGGFGDRRPKKDPVRDAELQKLAQELIEKVQAGEGPQQTEPLNSYERWVVHQEANDLAGITSRSIGEGSKKPVEFYEGEKPKLEQEPS